MHHKVKLLTGVSSAILFLIDCGDDGIGNGEVGGELSQEEAEELLHEAIEREEEIESLSSVLHYEITGEISGGEVDITSEYATDIASPENIRMRMSVDMPSENEPGGESELILVDGTAFINYDGSGWAQNDTMANEEEFGDELGEDVHFEELLARLDELVVYEEEDTYRFELSLEGEEAEAFSLAINREAGTIHESSTDDIARMGTSELDYELIIDKGTLWQEAFTMEMTVDGEQEGTEVTFDIYMTGTLFDHNEVEPIEAPE